uniref:Retrotransposon gag domain-containing protein n=1 Tax=Ananas comosus var. bracteatus TaxID=296719 RepID=A0A6V7P4C5_ANACO|nr:unnamed protein product [Ananas comosus var. bracteatus]
MLPLSTLRLNFRGNPSAARAENADSGERVRIARRSHGAVACGPEPQKKYTSKVHVPEPQHFKGMRNEKEIDNFLWHMEGYIKALRLNDEEEKVQIASMYLSDDFILWWRR